MDGLTLCLYNILHINYFHLSIADIAKSRFIEKEGGLTGNTNITGIIKHYQSFIQSINNNNNNEQQININYNTLMTDIDIYHAYVTRILHLNTVNINSLHEYTSEEQNIESKINNTINEIDELKLQIQSAKQWRTQQEEYENLLKECSEFPSRQHSIEQISTIEQQIRDTYEQIADIDQREEKKHKDMTLFMHSLKLLQNDNKRQSTTSNDNTNVEVATTGLTTPTSTDDGTMNND